MLGAGNVIPDGGEIQGTELGDIRKIVQGTNDFVANLQVLSDKFRDMAERVDKGEGTIGKFLKDPTFYNSWNQASSEILKLLYDFRQDPKKFLTVNFKLF